MSLRPPKPKHHPQETAQRWGSILKGAQHGELLVPITILLVGTNLSPSEQHHNLALSQ